MVALYNEIDPFAAAWLRELIRQDLIAPGDVAECSIEDLTPNDLRGYTQFHGFAGVGVWSYALRRAGWPDSRPIWTMSCPCQPFSAAGKGGGFADERHLWPAAHHLIRECRPGVVLGEQVASKDGLAWLDLVQADMEGTNYAFGAVDLCAAGVGAPHIRQRLWWIGENQLADADGRDASAERQQRGGEQRQQQEDRSPGRVGLAAGSGREWLRHQPEHGEPLQAVSHLDDRRSAGPTNGHWRDADWLFCRDGKWRPVEPGTFPLAHGAPARVGRLRGYGNAIVAQAAQTFIEAYLDIGTLEIEADRHLQLTAVSDLTNDNAGVFA